MGYETTPERKKSFDATPFVGTGEEATTVAPGVRENSQPTKERKEVEDFIKYVEQTGELLKVIRKTATGDDKKPPLTPDQKKSLRSDEFDLAA